MEKWRKPVKVVAVEPEPEGMLRIGDRYYRNYNITVQNQDEFERMKAGYVCINCLEPHEHPFPEQCAVCLFPIKAQQLYRIQQAYKGKQWVGPRESNDDEFARMDEEAERKKHNANSKIWLPGDPK